MEMGLVREIMDKCRRKTKCETGKVERQIKTNEKIKEKGCPATQPQGIRE